MAGKGHPAPYLWADSRAGSKAFSKYRREGTTSIEAFTQIFLAELLLSLVFKSSDPRKEVITFGRLLGLDKGYVMLGVMHKYFKTRGDTYDEEK